MGPGPPWSPEAPPKAYRLSCSCPVWRLLGSQLGASPEPECVGGGAMSAVCGHQRPTGSSTSSNLRKCRVHVPPVVPCPLPPPSAMLFSLIPPPPHTHCP